MVVSQAWGDASTMMGDPFGPALPRHKLLVEFDASHSRVIKRVALNTAVNELIVLFENREKAFVYRGAPFDLVDALTDPNDVSLSILVQELRLMSSSATIKFPNNVRPFEPGEILPKKRVPKPKRVHYVFKDFSATWLQLLGRVDELDPKTIGDTILPLLKSLHPCYAPSRRVMIAPPSSSSSPLPEFANLLSGGGGGGGVMGSIFCVLRPGDSSDSEEEEEEEENGGDGDGGDDQSASTAAASAAPTAASTQSRYLLVQFQCALAEKLRALAVAAQKQKNYVATRDHWVGAYEVMNAAYAVVVSWSGEVIFGEERAPQDIRHPAHNIPLAQQLYHAVPVLAYDTEREKLQAVRFLHQRKELLESKLNPMLSERKEIITRMGEETWKSNPAPKLTFVERRKQMEEDLYDITQCIHVIEPLSLIDPGGGGGGVGGGGGGRGGGRGGVGGRGMRGGFIGKPTAPPRLGP